MAHTAVSAAEASSPGSTFQANTWRSTSQDTEGSQETLLNSHFPMVLGIVTEMMHRLPPWIDRESLVQSGVVGLLDAAQRYDARRDVRFRVYAAYRIKGEIIEYLRSLDLASRGVRAWGRAITTARNRLITRYGRETSSEEMAAELNVSLERYHQMVRRVEDATLLSLTEASIAAAAEATTTQETFSPSWILDPAVEIENKDFVKKLTTAVDQLSAQERLVLKLYYYKELTLRKIGELLDLTEGRISQIHIKAVALLRQAMTMESIY